MQIKIGIFQYVLLALLNTRKVKTASDIQAVLTEKTETTPQLAQVCGALDRLNKRGLVRLVATKQKDGLGRPSLVYEITKTGSNELDFLRSFMKTAVGEG